MLNFVDYHGILMIVAWCFTAVAISAAHYLPAVWPNKKILGNRIWFHIHRTSNVISVLLIIASMVFILWEKGAWTGPWFGQDSQTNTSGPKWHSLIGAFAVLLAIGQGFGSLLFRYAPQHSRYDMISWFHRKIGKFACIAAAIALLIAILIFRKHFSSVPIAIGIYCFFFLALLWLAVGTNMAAWQKVQKTAVGPAVMNWAATRMDENPGEASRRGQSQSVRSNMWEGEMPEVSEKHQMAFFFIKSGIAVFTATVLIVLIIMH